MCHRSFFWINIAINKFDKNFLQWIAIFFVKSHFQFELIERGQKSQIAHNLKLVNGIVHHISLIFHFNLLEHFNIEHWNTVNTFYVTVRCWSMSSCEHYFFFWLKTRGFSGRYTRLWNQLSFDMSFMHSTIFFSLNWIYLCVFLFL